MTVQPPRIVVAGIGNPSRRDDGAGPAAATLAAQQIGGLARLVLTRDPSTLIDEWDGADLAVVVDAARTGAPPGTIATVDPASAGTSAPCSSHALGVGDAISLSHALGRAPRRIILYAIDVEDTSPGEGLSPAVAAAVREAAAEIAGQVLACA